MKNSQIVAAPDSRNSIDHYAKIDVISVKIQKKNYFGSKKFTFSTFGWNLLDQLVVLPIPSG